jgi:nitrogen fixation protein NifX
MGSRLRLVSEASSAELRLRVALATRDGERVDAHFGSARQFKIYEVSPASAQLVEAAVWDELSDESGTHDREVDRISPKVEALRGCNLLFCLAIGGPAAAKVIASKIHPIKLSEPESIVSVLGKVRTLMTDGDAPPWLRKALNTQKERSMDFLDQEDEA